MAPKKKEHSNDLRTLVIKHYLNGDSQREIAKKVLLSRPTVQSIIKKYKNTKCLGNLFGRGRKRKTTATTDRLIQRKLKLDRRKSARIITSEVEKDLGILISESTVKRRAHEVGLFGRVARKKPYVNKTNRLKRLKYAKEMLRKPLGFWDTIVWSDESEFNLFGSDGRIMVWRSRDEEFDPKCTVPTVKHGGGSVMV
jgi:transposase